MTFRLTVDYSDGRTTKIKTSDAIFMASTWVSVMEKRDADGVTGASIFYKAKPAPVAEKTTTNPFDPLATDLSPSFNPGPPNRPRPSEQLPARAMTRDPIITVLSPVGDVDVVNQSGKRTRTNDQEPTGKRQLTNNDIKNVTCLAAGVPTSGSPHYRSVLRRILPELLANIDFSNHGDIQRAWTRLLKEVIE